MEEAPEDPGDKSKMLDGQDGPKENEPLDKSSKSRNESGKSITSYGTTRSRNNSKSSVRSRSDPRFLKRMSSVTSPHPFERQSSRLSQVSSGKSLASIRTRHTSVPRSEYHEDLKPEIKSDININLIFATFVVAFGESFLFGWNIGVLNQPSKLIIDFYNKTYTERSGEQVSDDSVLVLWGLTTALFIPGGMIGAFLGGAVADRFGRKRGIIFSHLFTVIGAVLSCACVIAEAPELLMLGRVLVGINNGLGNCLAPMFLTEIAPYNLRGALGTVHQLSITCGILFSSIFGLQELLGTPTLWPYLILLELISTIVACGFLPFLPETPRYLLLCKGERELAKKSLQFYRRSEDIVTELEEMDTEHIQQSKTTVEAYTVKQFFKDKTLWKPLAIVCMLQAAQQFSGINAVFFYSSGIYKKSGLSDMLIPYSVIGTNAVNVAMTVIAIPLMDISGRRPLLLGPMCVMIFDLILLIIALHFQETVKWLSYVSITCIIIHVIGFSVGLGPIPMMVGSELFRQGPRPIAMACGGVVNWICTFVIAMTFEPIQEMIGEYTFVIFLILMIVFLLIIYFFVPETKNKTFEEIAHQFSPGDDLEVVEEFEDDVFGAEPVPNEAEDGEDHQLVTINFKEHTSEANTPEDHKEIGDSKA